MQDTDDDDWTDLVSNEMLTRRVTLDEYQAEHVVLASRGLVPQSKVDSDRAMLKPLIRPGEEWWEWIMGTEPLMQMGGLALVREGRVIWARNDWIS
jgi:hypothetical protein